MNTSGFLRRLWRWVRWPLFILFVLAFLLAILVFWRARVLIGDDETNADVARIHETRLVWSDINGELPPEPDPVENNKTLVGVDSNSNGIRDDVERAIYLKHKDTKRVAIAMLQYAKELQMEFTEVYNSETLVAVLEEESRGYSCAYGNEDEVKDLVFNTGTRKQYQEDILRKYMISWSIPNVKACDILP